jgi:hypothetical protein
MSQGRSLFRPVQAWHDETFLLVPKPSEEPAPPAAEATDIASNPFRAVTRQRQPAGRHCWPPGTRSAADC